MNQLIRTDIIDIIKVNIAGWGTIGFTQSGVIVMAEAAQAVGTAALVMATLVYTIFKLFRLLREMRWDKEDRENDNVNNT
jgi:hypothetical protein